ncbi:MAG: adenylosuccinate synthase [Mycoplasma sp.]
MSNSQIEVILGLQYGDEGKGKFTDILASDHDFIVRYQGGDNAGHSIVIDGVKYALRIIPSGIFSQKQTVIGNGCVVNPETLLNEIKYLEQVNFKTQGLLHLSDAAHVIFDYHIAIDKLNEENKGANKIGTTCKGIGPCYTDKVARIGIRVCDLYNRELLKQKLETSITEKNIILKHYNQPLFNVEEVLEKYFEIGKLIKPYVTNTSHLLNNAIEQGKKILLEGAQGVLLDIDHGTYPYVTSSAVATGMSSGTGIGVTKINSILGIVKAYTSRVGEGPFASEIHGELAEAIRIEGREFGTVTKRPRRIGWIDIVALKHAIRISGVTSIAITLLDVLSIVKEVKICTGYKFKGQEIDFIPPTREEYYECEPVCISMPGWNADISKVTDYNELPVECKEYLNKLESLLNTKITYVSVGPDRVQTIKVN